MQKKKKLKSQRTHKMYHKIINFNKKNKKLKEQFKILAKFKVTINY